MDVVDIHNIHENAQFYTKRYGKNTTMGMVSDACPWLR